jgi:hypothetical protein
MSSSNPFDDLAENTDDSEDSGGNDAGVERESQPRSDHEPDADLEPSTPTSTSSQRDIATSSEVSATAQDAAVEGPTLDNSSPPFPYSDAEQKQMYVQDGLWDKFEDLGFDGELELRRTFDVRNVEQRELDTAVIRLVLNQLTPREIAEMVIQMRGFDPSTLD